MLQRQRSIGRIENWHALNPKRGRHDSRAVPRFDPDPLSVKAPLRHFFIAGGYLDILGNDGIKADLINSIGGEVHPRAVLSLVGVTGRVDEVAGLGLVVPFRPAARDALLIALIENYVAFRHDFVGRLVNSYLVGLQSI